ncbi:hypothetical protein, partial [Flavivirga aquatica]|uniref:hypothetical protein n=1 Tax=Flavivirga aquatica TaxID=1849968 RepID=UPI0009F4D182
YNIRSLELLDSYISNFKEVFHTVKEHIKNEETNNFVKLEFKSASQIINKGEAVNVFGWWLTHPITNAPYKTPVNTVEEKETDLKFIANFERLSSYKGEFGFDWMRDEYKDICDDYNKLKKEYFPTSIHQEEYFVPTLSMFPNQDGVKLKLSVKKKEGIISDDDIIKLPSKSGIRFEPNEVKVNEANGKQITVICESPLNSDVMINLLDKNDKKVGAINIFKNSNHKQLHFNITPVRVLRGISKQGDIDIIEKQIDIEGIIKKNDGTIEKVKGWGDKGKDLTEDLKKLENYLNKESLNQALLQCNIGKVYDIVIDEDKWLDDDLIIDQGCVFKGSLLNKFSEEFKKQHPSIYKKRGITMFISPLENVDSDGEEGAGGYGNLGDIDSQYLAIFKTNLWSKDSFAHEIAHVSGLEHSFKEDKIYNDPLTLDEHNVYIKQVDANINYMLESGYSEREIAEYWSEHKKIYKKVKSKLNVYYRNLHKFEQGRTENMMDYYNKRKSFWKFQWKALQDDIIKFYNK